MLWRRVSLFGFWRRVSIQLFAITVMVLGLQLAAANSNAVVVNDSVSAEYARSLVSRAQAHYPLLIALAVNASMLLKSRVTSSQERRSFCHQLLSIHGSSGVFERE